MRSDQPHYRLVTRQAVLGIQPEAANAFLPTFNPKILLAAGFSARFTPTIAIFGLARFATHRPWLFHATDACNLPLIRTARCLLSATIAPSGRHVKPCGRAARRTVEPSVGLHIDRSAAASCAEHQVRLQWSVFSVRRTVQFHSAVSICAFSQPSPQEGHTKPTPESVTNGTARTSAPKIRSTQPGTPACFVHLVPAIRRIGIQFEHWPQAIFPHNVEQSKQVHEKYCPVVLKFSRGSARAPPKPPIAHRSSFPVRLRPHRPIA